MKKAILAALMAVVLTGCVHQQTPAELGRAIAKDAVLKDDKSLCHTGGWYYWVEKESPYLGERATATAALGIIKKELAFRNLKEDKTCMENMIRGAAAAKRHNAESKASIDQRAEQAERQSRADAY